MDHHGPPPPPPEECLILSRGRKYKGGTLIAEEVRTLQEHRRRMADIEAYRPRLCGACACAVLHVHDRPERHPRGVAMLAVLTVLRFICANPDCRATWRVLPAFLARHLWWGWEPIARATLPAGASEAAEADAPVPSPTTCRRWLGRLQSSARQLVALLASRGHGALKRVAASVGMECTRLTLVREHGDQRDIGGLWQLATLAALFDRLERGIRLM